MDAGITCKSAAEVQEGKPEKDSQRVLQDPSPVLAPEDGPDDRDADGANQEDQLTQLEGRHADVHVATGEPEGGAAEERKSF